MKLNSLVLHALAKGHKSHSIKTGKDLKIASWWVPPFFLFFAGFSSLLTLDGQIV